MSARGPFPQTRMRRLRASAFARDMVRESTLSPADFIYPVFVLEGSGQREAVPSMPGVDNRYLLFHPLLHQRKFLK